MPVSSQFERVLFVKDGETTCFAFVEELIAHYAATIFSASTVQKQCLFRVTRNADITVDEGMMDHDVDFRDVMSELLKMVLCITVEFYAILSLLASMLMIINISA